MRASAVAGILSVFRHVRSREALRGLHRLGGLAFPRVRFLLVVSLGRFILNNPSGRPVADCLVDGALGLLVNVDRDPPECAEP